MKIIKNLQIKSKQKLYRQWVERAGLPPEESMQEPDSAAEDTAIEEVPKYTAPIEIDKGMVRLPIRYLLLLLSIIVLLLVALSVVVTILITRS